MNARLACSLRLESSMKRASLWWVPTLLILLITPFTIKLDQFFAQCFFTLENMGGSHFVENSFTRFFYHFGVLPGIFLVVGSTVAFILSFFYGSLKKYRPAFLTLFLVLSIGSGFIVNMGFKDHWGRPRPLQTTTFGGGEDYRPFYKVNLSVKDKKLRSFPSGHATMGFYFFSLLLTARRYRSRRIALFSLVCLLFFGGGIAWSRIAQGAHYFSDVLFSAYIMWLSSLFFDWLCFEKVRWKEDKTHFSEENEVIFCK